MAQKPPSEFLLIASGIQHRVPRRTLSPHPAFPSSVHLGFQAKEIPEPMARLALGLQTEQPLPCAAIHGYHSATWLLGYLCLGPADELPPFPLWPAFPTSEYYGGSDAQHGL